MNAQDLLDQILKTGRELTTQGQGLAEKKLGIPESGPERDATLASMGKGAAVAGALALLLGTNAGRSVTGAGLKLGSLAALGGLAFKAYQSWQANQPSESTTSAQAKPVDQLQGPEADQRSRLLLRAMIGAAKADGHIDAEEHARIDGLIKQIGLDDATRQFLEAELAKPLDLDEIAAGVDSPAVAGEIYLASLLMIDTRSPEERAYLDQLALHLQLSPAVTAELEAQAKGA